MPWVMERGQDWAEAGRLELKEARVRRAFWPKLRRSLGRVPFVEDLVAAYFCAIDPATPTRTKAILLGALAYFILPVDIIPDFIVGLGFTDDAAVLMAALNAIAPHLSERHRQRARTALALEAEKTVSV
jgi:uncharacterized membrane protein YkvA (DUF1232 family)